jgi:hypothetical protein
MGLALSVKRGETPRSKASAEVLKIVDSMSEKELEKYAGTAHKGLPKKVESKIREIVREVYNEMKSVNEGKKAFKVNPPIGKAKYSISSHDGHKKHNDGSDFWDIKIYKNKIDLEKGIKDYKSKGFIEESVNEATTSDVIKDLDKAKNDLLKKVDVLIAKKKKLYSNVDIETPMSADEKKLDKDIADLFSDINKLVLQKRSLKKESVTEEKVVTKKEWDRTHKDFKGMVDGKHYMMYLDPKTGSTVYGPVTIKESVNEDIWTPQQKSAVSKLDSEFDELLAKRGIEPHSKEASNLWRTSGFQNKFKKIFNKTESVTEVKMNVKIDTTSVANLVSTAGRNNVRKVEVTLKSPKSMGEWDALQKTVNTSLWPDKLLQSVIKDMNTEKTITYDVVNDALDIVDLFKNDSKRIKTANWKN